MDINVRSFGGEIDNVQNCINAHQLQPARPATTRTATSTTACPPATIAATLAKCNDQSTAACSAAALSTSRPGLKGQYTDEYIAGAEYELLPDFKIGITYTHRNLPVIIEDASTDGGAELPDREPRHELRPRRGDLARGPGRCRRWRRTTRRRHAEQACDAQREPRGPAPRGEAVRQAHPQLRRAHAAPRRSARPTSRC